MLDHKLYQWGYGVQHFNFKLYENIWHVHRSSSVMMCLICNPKTLEKRMSAVVLEVSKAFCFTQSTSKVDLACNKAVALEVPLAEKTISRRT